MAERTGREGAQRPISVSSARAASSTTRISRKLVTLSSAAILTVYALGYVRTQEAAARAGAPNETPIDASPRAAAAPNTTTSTPTPPPAREVSRDSERAGTREGTRNNELGVAPPTREAARSGATSTPSSATPAPSATPTRTQPTPTVAPALVVPTVTTGAFIDGTYVGTGSSRHGGIEATVVVASGKVRSAAISQCLTRYSCSVIAALPGQVVARQSASVDLISGATDSSRAFIQAVTNALARAR